MVFIIIMTRKNYTLRYIAEHPIQEIYTGSRIEIGQPIPKSAYLSVVVWNIFKQQKSNWLSVLKQYAKDCQLVLLQEAQTTPELVNFATSNFLVADQVPALTLATHPSGVMTLSTAHPVYCCPLIKTEPLLRLPKSALITVYPLYDGRLLMTVNIHAINFSIGCANYQQQLEAVVEPIMSHRGPVILAGDFNTWNRRRLRILFRLIRYMRLQKVKFHQDFRKKAFGLPLDFIFYRDLNVNEAHVIRTQASDHNPLQVKFFMGSHND